MIMENLFWWLPHDWKFISDSYLATKKYFLNSESDSKSNINIIPEADIEEKSKYSCAYDVHNIYIQAENTLIFYDTVIQYIEEHTKICLEHIPLHIVVYIKNENSVEKIICNYEDVLSYEDFLSWIFYQETCENKYIENMFIDFDETNVIERLIFINVCSVVFLRSYYDM